MNENYSVAVHLSLVENVSKGLVSLAAHFATLNQSASLFQAKLQSIKSQLFLGGMAVGFGAALAAPMLGAIKTAGNLQQQLLFIQEKTKANTDEMYKFRGAIEDVAGMTGFTSTEAASAAKTLALGLNTNISQLQKVIPLFLEFAAVQKSMKGTDISKSVTQALQLVHLTGEKTDPASIKKNLDLLAKISLVMPGDITKVLNAQKYAQGTLGNLLGVSTEQSLLFFAALNRMGIENTRAGTQLLQAINRSMGKGILWAGLLPGKSGEKLEQIGLTKNNVPQFLNNGKFDTQKWLGILNAFIKKEYATKAANVATGEIATAFAQTLGTTGTRIAAVASTDEGRKQIEELTKSFESMPDLTEQFKQLQTLLNFQLTRSLKNINSLFAELGYALVPDATNVMGIFADKIRALTLWVHEHSETVAHFEELLLGFAGFTVLSGLLLIIKAGLSALLIPINALIIRLPLFALSLTLANLPVALTIAAIALVGFAFYELYEHADELWTYLKSYKLFQFLIDSFNSLEKVAISVMNKIILAYNYVIDKLGFNKSHQIGLISQIGSRPERNANTTLSRNAAEKDLGTFDKLKYYGKEIFAAGKQGLDTYNSLMDALNKPDNAGINKNQTAAASSPYIRKAPQWNIYGNNQGQNNPIQVTTHINLDGHKLATAFSNHVYGTASKVPNSSSTFDTNLSPMPTNTNIWGISY